MQPLRKFVEQAIAVRFGRIACCRCDGPASSDHPKQLVDTGSVRAAPARHGLGRSSVTLTIPTELARQVLRDVPRFDLIEADMPLCQEAQEQPGEYDVMNDDRWSVSRQR